MVRPHVTSSRVWSVDETTGKLISPYDDTSIPLIKEAQAFTVSITTISSQVFSRENLVALNYKNFGNSDLFILTSSSLGDRPLTHRAHYHTRTIDNEPVLTLFAENIHVNEDYSGNERFYFELKLVSIPTNDDEFVATQKAFGQLANLVGSIFPVIAPVVSISKLAVDVFSRIFHKVETIPREVISLPMAFYPSASLGDAPLKAGSYVIFQTSRKVDSLTLNSEAVIIDETGKSLAEPYFVVNVKNSIVVAPDHLSEISGQKMATLLSQISSQESGAARTLDFLQDTLDSYRKFKLIERYHQLKSIASRTLEEQVRLDEIFKEVKNYVK